MSKNAMINLRKTRILEGYNKNKIPGFEVLIDNVWDVHNVSAVLRSADGFGISKLWLYYTHNDFPDLSKDGKKSSSSANKWVSTERITDIKSFIDKKKSEGWVIIGADFNPDDSRSVILNDYVFPPKTLLVLGSEHQGISPELKFLCDVFVFIPMVGLVKSYNISVAAAVLFYEAYKQKGKGLKLRS